MSVELSRRLARVAHQPPILGLSLAERHELWRAAEYAKTFEELGPRCQELILLAEDARERAIARERDLSD
ncbi:MAG: hypothetical protein HYX51_06095 [Chloroflexi bacterium]|nr:hypothetical protein [Chloroflexota bacterium]